jgi:hypothetical protein
MGLDLSIEKSRLAMDSFLESDRVKEGAFVLALVSVLKSSCVCYSTYRL